MNQSDLSRHSANAAYNEASKAVAQHPGLHIHVFPKSRVKTLEFELARARETNEALLAENSSLKREIARLKPKAAQRGPDLRQVLSSREYEVLSLLAEGLLYKEISDRLGIAFETTHTYVRRAYDRLGVHTRTEAVVKFLNSR